MDAETCPGLRPTYNKRGTETQLPGCVRSCTWHATTSADVLQGRGRHRQRGETGRFVFDESLMSPEGEQRRHLRGRGRGSEWAARGCRRTPGEKRGEVMGKKRRGSEQGGGADASKGREVRCGGAQGSLPFAPSSSPPPFFSLPQAPLPRTVLYPPCVSSPSPPSFSPSPLLVSTLPRIAPVAYSILRAEAITIVGHSESAFW